MSSEPRFLVVDGYKKACREELAAGGACPAGELYRRMLSRCAPGCTVDIVYPADPGTMLPAGVELATYDGLAWTGSSLCVHKRDDPNVIPQVELAKAAFDHQVPSFGSCWAAQIGVVAAGGRCAENPRGREMGIARKINLTPEGRAHPMYFGKDSVFDAFISHEDEVTHLPPGAINLARNRFTDVQAVAITHNGGTMWAVQYHPEYNLRELARLTFCRIDKLVNLGFFENREAALDYVNKLETLYENPERSDLAWLLGIDADVVNEDVRWVEVRNWIEHWWSPSMQR